MISYLQGKKTYSVGICGILYAIFGFISGHLDSVTAISTIFASLGLMGLRNGLTTEIQNIVGMLPDKTLGAQATKSSESK